VTTSTQLPCNICPLKIESRGPPRACTGQLFEKTENRTNSTQKAQKQPYPISLNSAPSLMLVPIAPYICIRYAGSAGEEEGAVDKLRKAVRRQEKEAVDKLREAIRRQEGSRGYTERTGTSS
jgi:hypothetical protein